MSGGGTVFLDGERMARHEKRGRLDDLLFQASVNPYRFERLGMRQLLQLDVGIVLVLDRRSLKLGFRRGF